MNTYLANVWDTLRTSFWFVPGVLGLLAVSASLLVPQLDEFFREPPLEWTRTTIPAARSTLSAIAAAMMTVAGTVFSITIVTLSLTSQQFGPRLLRSFMLDFPTQLTIGTFLSTGIYSLLVLRIVEKSEAAMLPHLSVALAVLLSVLSMGLLIYFVHHVAVLIQAAHIVAAVAHDLDDSIRRLFPERLGQAPAGAEDEPPEESEHPQPKGDTSRLLSSSEGYIQAIDADGLMRLATKSDVIIRLLRRPGHYVSQEDPMAEVWRSQGQDLTELSQAFNDCVIVGMRRTPRQDVECAIEELVEVAVRSLSPGINDPFTAINCIDRLGSSLGRFAERKIPAAHRFDEAGGLRVITPQVTFADAVDACFNPIRQYGSGCPAVLIRLLETFAAVMRHTRRPADRESLQQHGDKVLAAAEKSVPSESDLNAIRERHRRLRPE